MGISTDVEENLLRVQKIHNQSISEFNNHWINKYQQQLWQSLLSQWKNTDIKNIEMQIFKAMKQWEIYTNQTNLQPFTASKMKYDKNQTK